MAGRPRDQENIHFRNMKNGKRKLRSTQRQLEAVARKQKFENIMTAREGDQKLFFKLVNDQRRTEQVEKVINTLKSGKAADCANLTSEHLKNGGQIVISAVTKLINMIFDVCSIPDLLKLGIATPVYKRKGKPLDDPNSYRKITVTSILNKILEKLYLEKKDETLKNAQSPLQRGFTKGISGLNAALILNELIAEAQDMHRPLYVAFLDAQKAFDLVWHSSLLRKLHQSCVESDSWLIFKESLIYFEIPNLQNRKYNICTDGRSERVKQLNPTVSIHIIRIFIIPRLIHGLEVVRLMISDIKALSSYFKQLLKRIQHLPERTADSATYLLSGQMPIEAEIDKRTLTLFGNIIRNPNTVEFKLAQRQLAIKDRNSKSWFTYVQQLLEKYNLPSSSVLLQEPPGKFSWKNLVSKAVKTYWTNKIHSEAREKSSLQYINFEQLTFDNPHLVWKSAKFEHFSIQRAGIKCRLMLDTYLLQIHKQKFNKYEVDSTCLLCHNGAEDRKHFLIQCVALDSIRSPFLKILHEKTTEVVRDVKLTDAIFEQPDELLSLILDCTGYQVIPPSRQEEFEAVSRGLCFALHIERSDRIKTLQ
ncbi:unnamed protein product [Mytilus edulis]|uniref:Reverse transcriptase domain-containing protein n=1 Tax=Mytilus edulis TaxID=6550 RepID=A0A8S3TE73_MYTED|nr:unnamed protein product [Mytilus edulis]